MDEQMNITMTAMTPPTVQYTETPISLLWMNDNGILHSMIKADYDPNNFEANKQTFDIMENYAKGSKIKLIVETGKLKSGSKEIRAYADERLPNFLSAAAYITPNSFSKMVMNIYVGGKKRPYPIRFFSNYDEALAWLTKVI